MCVFTCIVHFLRSFNGASTSLLKKCLKRITSVMSTAGFSSFYKQPSNELIDSIIFTSNGDIRNAVINLHFASQKSLLPSPRPNRIGSSFVIFSSDSSSLDVKAVQTTSKTKGTKKNNKFRSLGCDDAITFMHALGRVLNPKCKFNFEFFRTFCEDW